MKKEKQQIKATVGRVLNDGSFIEMIYDPFYETGCFAFKAEGSDIEIVDNQEDRITNILYVPLMNDSISNKHFLLPSRVCVEETQISTLFDIVRSFILKYVDLSEDSASIAAAYAMMTHVYDMFEKVPYLRFFGPHGSGKSRALSIMRSICYHSINLGASQTAPNIFRALDMLQTGTLFLDEANFLDTSRTSDLTKILNDGYSRDGVVFRCDPKTNETKPYRVFSPKVLASNVSYDDPALESRMLTIEMKPSRRKDLPLSLPPLAYFDEAVIIRNMLLRYRLDYNASTRDQKYEKLSKFDARVREIISPLLWAQELYTVPLYIMDYLDNLQNSRRERQMFDEDAIVAEVAITLKNEGKSSVTLLDIRNFVLEKGQIDVSFKRLGHHLRQFGASAYRASQGYVFNPQTINVEYLKNRYGL